jgi:Cof subfamily protein (haloacid dehalogenase superfamily)
VTVRLIASDIDGTLLRSDGSMSARTRDALAAAEEAGLVVVLCTGRPPRWMGAIAGMTGHRGLAVCANGALVYDLHREEVVETFPIDVEVGRKLAEALRDAVPGIAFAVERPDRFGHEPAYHAMYEVPDDTLVAELEDLLAEPMAKLIARHPDLEADELHERIHEAMVDLADLAQATYSGLSIVEISAAGVSKAFALERLAREHGVAAAEVVAFGDMPNDIPLLTWAGRSVAMGNAHPDVVAVADEQTATNDEDGVAVVVEEILGLA